MFMKEHTRSWRSTCPDEPIHTLHHKCSTKWRNDIVWNTDPLEECLINVLTYFGSSMVQISPAQLDFSLVHLYWNHYHINIRSCSTHTNHYHGPYIRVFTKHIIIPRTLKYTLLYYTTLGGGRRGTQGMCPLSLSLSGSVCVVYNQCLYNSAQTAAVEACCYL